MIDNNKLQSLFAIKQLQSNLKHSFNISMSDRNSIINSLVCLLNVSLPHCYIFRTDISSFFESIPQGRLMDIIQTNPLLSYRSKSLINGILKVFNNLKDKTLIKEGYGIPRGIGISSMLSEIYMREIDNYFLNCNEVLYYARYVDDVIIVTNSIANESDANNYYSNIIKTKFDEYDLKLKDIGDRKCVCFSHPKKVDGTINPQSVHFDYLGYNVMVKSDANGLATTLDLSNRKQETLKKRINRSFVHFYHLCKVNIGMARKDLLDSLELISSNYFLYNSKSNVKVGIYYNNRLISNTNSLDGISKYLKSKLRQLNSKLDVKFFNNDKDVKLNFINKLCSKINKIQFDERWTEKRIVRFSKERLMQILEWL